MHFLKSPINDFERCERSDFFLRKNKAEETYKYFCSLL